MRIRSGVRRAFNLPIILGATLLFAPLEVHAAGAERIKLRIHVNSGSGLTLAQASDEESSAGRKRYEAAVERARAALEAEKSARRVNEALPSIPGNAKSDISNAVCIAGC